jgi:hypothetical protein
MRFAKAQEKKMGKPEAPVVVKRGPQKSPISKIWISTLSPSRHISSLQREQREAHSCLRCERRAGKKEAVMREAMRQDKWPKNQES